MTDAQAFWSSVTLLLLMVACAGYLFGSLMVSLVKWLRS